MSENSLFLKPIHFRIAGIVLAITGIVALLLGLVNGATKDRIAAITLEKAAAGRAAVLPEAVEFTDLEYTEDNILSVYEAAGSDGKLLGFAIETCAKGFGGTIDQMVGILCEATEGGYSLTITGIELLDISDETPGVGSKISSESFLSQFSGKNASSLNDSFQAVTGASYSSKGSRDGAAAALALAQKLVEKKGGTVVA